MKLSVVIPAHDEAESIAETLRGLAGTLDAGSIDYELLVVDDASSDGTLDAVRSAAAENPRIRGIASPLRPSG